MIRSAVSLILIAATVLGWASDALAVSDVEEPPVPATIGAEPNPHQDSFLLTRLGSGVLPPDGLLSVTFGVRQSSTVLILDDLLERIEQLDAFLRLEAIPLPWLALQAELPWRTWSGGRDWVPASGGGLSDGSWRVATGSALWPGSWLHASVFGGGNLPLGSEDEGLGEGVFSPEVGAALTMSLWRRADVPEMRLHLNLARRWNRNEVSGYGQGVSGFQPWSPRYASSAAMGGDEQNDVTRFGAALEFRKTTTSLWLEYSEDRFPTDDVVSRKEMYRGVAAGLRWGVVEGWALLADYQVSLSIDDLATEWQPGFPEMVSTLAVSHQFGFGGRDRDGDGIVDRRDRCPLAAEDLDGYQDDDGCPDLDNDLDGVPDDIDLAPDSAEDIDGYLDGDGLPDPDNDQDGIPDELDLCPDEAEDLDGHRDEDGCPDAFMDRDGDGIEDSQDGCPDLAEDMDGFEDDDGCPEADNDMDGLPDEEDACPDEAEDYDGDADGDGCPEEEETEE